ncbi:MAG: PucR family transcriptional regulator [Anaerovoracaceae bacterium]|jgi:hypothetical protein
MKLTVGDCLELSTFEDARIAAGRRGLSREVTTVSFLDAESWQEAERYNAERGQLTLTTFSGVRQSEFEQCQIVEKFAAAGNAGLVVFHEKDVLGQISRKVVDLAEKLDFPLIVMSEKTDPRGSVVIREVTNRIFYGSTEAADNSLVANIVMHLMNFEKYSGFMEAVRSAAVNNNLELGLLSDSFNVVFVVETHHNVTVDEAVKKARTNARLADKVAGTLVDVRGLKTYWWPVGIGDKKYYLMLVDPDDQYSAAQMVMVAEIVELAIGMWKYTPIKDSNAEFINALIRGNLKQAFELSDEAGVDPDDIVSVFLASGVEKESAKRLASELGKRDDLRMISIQEGDSVYGVMLKSGGCDRKSAAGLKTECIEVYNSLKLQRSIRVFHVTGLKGLDGAYDGYRLITEAQSCTEIVFPYKRVFTKYDLALVSNCIGIQIRGGYLKKDYEDLLEGFEDVGANKGHQLLDTLETFVLDAGMNGSKTAEFMGIHVNTVQYRLKRINEILGAEISANRVLPGLTMALALSRLDRMS